MPPRITCAFGADIFFRAARAASAFDSWMTPTTAFKATMTMMAIASIYSPNRSEIIAATINRMTRKLLNWSNSIEKNPGGLFLELVRPMRLQPFLGLFLGKPFFEMGFQFAGKIVNAFKVTFVNNHIQTSFF